MERLINNEAKALPFDRIVASVMRRSLRVLLESLYGFLTCGPKAVEPRKRR
jgi:hypothetical protein